MHTDLISLFFLFWAPSLKENDMVWQEQKLRSAVTSHAAMRPFSVRIRGCLL